MSFEVDVFKSPTNFPNAPNSTSVCFTSGVLYANSKSAIMDARCNPQSVVTAPVAGVMHAIKLINAPHSTSGFQFSWFLESKPGSVNERASCVRVMTSSNWERTSA